MNSSRHWRRRPAATLGLVMAALVVMGAIYALLNASTSAQAAGRPGSETAVEEGKALYLQGCSSCHGLNAEGTSVAPSLIGVGAAAVDFQLVTGRMPMAQPGVQVPRKAPSYNEVEIAQLAAYIDTLGPGPDIPTPEQLDTTTADLARGGALFRTNCAQCHNFAGSGAALTEGKYAPSLMEATSKEIYEAMLTGPQNMPVFGDGTLPEQDKKDIIKYIEHMQTQTQPGGFDLGSFGPVTEGLFAFLAMVIIFGAATVWIGAKVR